MTSSAKESPGKPSTCKHEQQSKLVSWIFLVMLKQTNQYPEPRWICAEHVSEEPEKAGVLMHLGVV